MWLVLLFQKSSSIQTYKLSGVENTGSIGFLPVFDEYDTALDFADGDVSKLQEIDYD
jgi:hypothetical protein